MCDQWKHLADPYVADELCNYRGCQAESLNHPEALFHMNTGSRLGGDPALGCLGDLRTGNRESEPARLRGDDRIGVAARWADQLEQRLSAAVLSGNPPATRKDRRFSISLRKASNRENINAVRSMNSPG